jgi:hypothetical protein
MGNMIVLPSPSSSKQPSENVIEIFNLIIVFRIYFVFNRIRIHLLSIVRGMGQDGMGRDRAGWDETRPIDPAGLQVNLHMAQCGNAVMR